MTTKELLDAQKDLATEVDFYESVLNNYDEFREGMGLLPDKIRNTTEYKAAKAGFIKSFKALQTFNSTHRKELNKLSWSKRLLY